MAWTRAVGLAVIAGFGACVGPRMPIPAGDPVVDLARFPPGTEAIAVEVATGERLAGVWIAGEPGAPVVLQFLENGASITRGAGGSWGFPVLWHLRDLGVSVLALDYRGVGASEGEASVEHLADDAAAAYAEAVRRAGGEANVVVRGGSLGTLAIAALLERGHRPAAVVLGAPGDIVRALTAYSGPKLAFLAGADALVDADERDAIAAAVRSFDGRVVVDALATHDDVLLRSHSLLAAEQTLYATAFPGRVRIVGDLFQRRMIDSPVIAHALAEAQSGGAAVDLFEEGLLLRWIRRLPPAFADAFPDDALRALFDFGDPLGRLDPRELEWMGDVVAEVDAARGTTPLPEALLAQVAASELERRSRYAIRHAWSQEPIADAECDLADGPPPWGAPARLNLDAANRRRQLLRSALKAAGLPDRVTFDARATPVIEVFERGAWRRMDTTSTIAPTPDRPGP